MPLTCGLDAGLYCLSTMKNKYYVTKKTFLILLNQTNKVHSPTPELCAVFFTNAKPKSFDPGLFQGYIMTDMLCAQVSGENYGVICTLKHMSLKAVHSLRGKMLRYYGKIFFFFKKKAISCNHGDLVHLNRKGCYLYLSNLIKQDNLRDFFH